MNTTPVLSWSPALRLIHWLSAALIFILLPLGWWMVDLGYYDEWYHSAPLWHRSLGVYLIALTLIRLILRLIQQRPELKGQGWQQWAARAAHAGLYFLIGFLLISGVLMAGADGNHIMIAGDIAIPSIAELSASWTDRLGLWHHQASMMLLALIVLHTAAALKHHIVDRDDSLRRMIKANGAQDD